MALERHTIIKIHIPFRGDQPKSWPLSFDLLKKYCPGLAEIIQTISKHRPIGRIGQYDDIFELEFGFEGYTPQPGSNPTEGKIGEASAIRSVVLTTYAADTCSLESIRAFASDVAQRHPWEHPIIEVHRGPGVFVWDM